MTTPISNMPDQPPKQERRVSVRTATQIRNLAAESIHLLSLNETKLDPDLLKQLVDKQIKVVELAVRMDARTGKVDPSKRTSV